MYKPKIYIIQILIVASLSAFSQQLKNASDTTVLSHINNATCPSYLEIGTGLGIGSLRDFATSPLVYVGPGFNATLGYVAKNEERETNINTRTVVSLLISTGVKELSTATVISSFISYSELFKIKKWSSEKWNIKLGGTFDATTNIRINPSLNNNSSGFEMINTLFASGKLTYDVSRKTDILIKSGKYSRIARVRKREICYQLNIPVMNNTLRNGFIYFNPSVVVNEPNLFFGYKYKVFSGFRINSTIDYVMYMKNKNALKLTYAWDAYKTGGNLDKLYVANHVVLFSLLFNLK